MGLSKISVDLNQRTFDIEVPDENIESVLQMLAKLFSDLPPRTSRATVEHSHSQNSAADTEIEEENANDEPLKAKRKRAPGKGAAKVKAPELIDLGLTAEQRRELVSYFAEKAPKGQNDQVAVLGVKLKEFKGKNEFSMDEIHSAFKVVNKPTPRNLLAVFGNMKRDGRAQYSEGNLVVNSFTEDHVSFHMNSEKDK